MFGLPKTTDFNKKIPKQKFYEKLEITPALKRVFVEQIKAVYWTNKIAASTTNLAVGKYVSEIEVFKVELSSDNLDLSALQLIDKAIPYHNVFILSYDGKCQALATYKYKSETLRCETVAKATCETATDVACGNCPKASTRGEVSRSDGGVTEFGANSNSREQTSSQEKNWIATASAKPRNDGSVKQGLFQRTEDTSGSVALSACLQATSPQGEALERIDTIRGRTHTKGSKSFFRTPWLPESELTLPINGLDLDTVYENIVRFIAGDELISKEGREESLQESIQRAELRQKLTKQIERLQSKINKEKSFARQVELNTQLKALKHQLEELK